MSDSNLRIDEKAASDKVAITALAQAAEDLPRPTGGDNRRVFRSLRTPPLSD
jgi:hypothetical protein